MDLDIIAEKIFRNTEKLGECLIWKGFINKKGFGNIKIWDQKIKRQLYAHKLVYIWFNKLEYLDLDNFVVKQTCGNKTCCNPEHLEKITKKESLLSGNSPLAKNARKTHCKRGHEFTIENIRYKGGGRLCRECELVAKLGQEEVEKVYQRGVCILGHKLTLVNTYQDSFTGERECLTCLEINLRSWDIKRQEIRKDINISNWLSEENLDFIFSRLHLKDGHWIWHGNTNPSGYGIYSVNGFNRRTHRILYYLFKGNLSKNLEMDHLCRVRNCSNPEHLEEVTDRENVVRGISPPAINAGKTHCKNGHEFNENNTKYILQKNGSFNRCCIICNKEWQINYYKKQKEAKLLKEI